MTLAQVSNAVKETAKKTAKNINARAAEKFGGKKYKKSWKHKQDTNLTGRWKYSEVVYSTEYRIAHLLENGHAKRNGGRVEGKEHIAPSAEEAKDILVDAVLNEME